MGKMLGLSKASGGRITFRANDAGRVEAGRSGFLYPLVFHSQEWILRVEFSSLLLLF